LPFPTLPTATQITQFAPTTGTSGQTGVGNTVLTLLSAFCAALKGLALKDTIAVPGDVTATGTPSSTTFLRGDGAWAVPAGTGGAGAISSVFGRTGAVVAVAGDYNGAQVAETRSATNYTATAGTVEGHLAGIDTQLAVLAAADSGGGGSGLTATAILTANATVSSGQYVRTDTTSASLTITLPASPSDGAEIMIIDASAAGSWGVHALTVAPNGKNLNGSSASVALGFSGGRISLRYNSTGGWVGVDSIRTQPLAASGNLVELANDQTALNNIMAGNIVPNHLFTEQAAKTANYTLVVGDSGTQIPVNVTGGGTVTAPTYSAAFKGFGCDVFAVTATTVRGTTSGALALAAGESAHVRTRNGTWRFARITDTPAA
jgi:hypothetical protein